MIHINQIEAKNWTKRHILLACRQKNAPKSVGSVISCFAYLVSCNIFWLNSGNKIKSEKSSEVTKSESSRKVPMATKSTYKFVILLKGCSWKKTTYTDTENNENLRHLGWTPQALKFCNILRVFSEQISEKHKADYTYFFMLQSSTENKLHI